MSAASVLELVVGGFPLPHRGPSGEWRYRHAVRPEGPGPADHKAVADFLAYEAAHGRTVTVVADDALSDWATWPPPRARARPGSLPTQCCTDAYATGCGANLVCHGTPAAAAAQVLHRGALVAATVVTGRTAAELAAVSTWGDPPDSFDHVTLANGRCTAPEAVARSRSIGRDLVPSDLSRGYPPAVRFYFRPDALVEHAGAAFDGVHPIKFRRELALDGAFVAVVAHHDQRDLVAPAVPPRLRRRLVILDLEDPTPAEWATAAFDAAEHLA